MKARNHHVMLLALGATLLLLPACGKKSLDKNVDRLVKAAKANDYKAFKEMSHPDLVSKFSAEKFKLLSDSLNLLGAYKDRSMRGIKARTGKVREGRYKLTFEKGTVRLKITLVRGKLMGFMFSGDDMNEAMKKVRKRLYSEYKVGSFEFLDEANKRKNNVFGAGKKIRFKLAIYGMKRQGGTLKIQAALAVEDASGKVLIQNPKLVDSAVPIGADDIPVGTVTGSFKIANPGHYTVRLQVTDGHTGKKLDYKTALLIEK